MAAAAKHVGWRIGLAIVAAACSCASHEPGDARGSWRLAAPLTEPRGWHSLTRLPDGRVLAAGGLERFTESLTGTARASAELYDPVAGTWTPTGSMHTPRALHPAVLLPTGKVLVAGGCAGWKDSCLFSAEAELYDPATGAWEVTGAMHHARAGPSSLALLEDGAVLAAGSYVGGSLTGPHSEVYDPASGTWTEVQGMIHARIAPALVRLDSGEVLAVGGTNDPAGGSGVDWVELYDPVTPSWRETARSDRREINSVLALLPTGEVLLVGGCTDQWDPCGSPLRTEGRLYNRVREDWRATSPMTYSRNQASVVSLPSGKVLAAGGNFLVLPPTGGRDYYTAPAADLYDPWDDTGTPTPVLPHYEMGGGAAALLPSGEVLFVGGFELSGSPIENPYLSPISAVQIYWPL